jgi:hypothetical protein
MYRYEEILERIPRSTSVGDRRLAKEFVRFLTDIFLNHGQLAVLTVANKTYLYKLKAVWTARAAGTDARWNAIGSTPGRAAVKPGRQRPERIRRRYENADKEFETYDDVAQRIIMRYRDVKLDE